MSVMVTTCRSDLPVDPYDDTADYPAAGVSLPASNGKLIRLRMAPATAEQRILAVEFRSPNGRS